MDKFLTKIWGKIISSYFWQFLILASLVSLAFYKIFSFTFHANREMGWFIQMTGGDFSFMNLLKSHGFISLFNYKLFDADPRGWYLTALILHILATWMLVVFINALTKNRVIGFLTGIWFGVSLSWHDAITFGSQESMYSAQLTLFLIALFFYRRFRENIHPRASYIISLTSLILTLPLRELGLIFFPILFFFDLIFYHPFSKKKSFKENINLAIKFLIPQVPFIAIAVSYFVFFRLTGGPPHYFADERVRFQHKLLSEKQYLEYLFISLASFGTYLPPHIIPYPFLNWLRNTVAHLLPLYPLKVYFFSLFGCLFYFILWILAFRSRKRNIFPILLFAIVMVTIPTFFYSFAVTMDETFFLRDYLYDENRWRYFAFVGTSLFLIVYFSQFFKRKLNKKVLPLIAGLIIVGNLTLNIGLLWHEENKMYQDMFRSQKLFYKTIMEIFPTYKEDNVLYAYPASYRLGDYLWEWRNLKEFYYPDLGEVRKDWVYGEMEKVLKDISENKFLLDDVFFIGFDPNKGVIDYTQQAKEAILDQKIVEISFNKSLPIGNKISLPVSEISSVEFPYLAEITLKVNFGGSLSPAKTAKKLSQKEVNALLAYAKSRLKLARTMKVEEVCHTQGNMIVYQPEHLIDGNFGERSTWWADCLPGWFILDLGKIYNISGFITGGIKDSPHLPLHYYYDVSNDAVNWEKVMEIKENKRWEIMDKWPKTYKARYIRVTVLSTQKGSFVRFDEAEPVLAEAEDVFNLWTSRKELTERIHETSYKISNTFGKLIWQTNLRTLPEEQTTFYFSILADGQYHTYKIPIYESEYYSLPGQFLKRHIEEIRLDFSSFPGTIFLKNITLRPKIPIERKEILLKNE